MKVLLKVLREEWIAITLLLSLIIISSLFYYNTQFVGFLNICKSLLLCIPILIGLLYINEKFIRPYCDKKAEEMQKEIEAKDNKNES